MNNEKTLTNVAKSKAFEFKVDYKPFKTDLDYRLYAEYGFEKGFIAGFESQIKKMYNKKDMKSAWEDGRKFEYDHNGEGGEFTGAESFEEWIEEFKKK